MAINTIEQCSQRGRRSPSVLSQQNANRRKARCLKWQKLARKLFYPDFDFWLLRLVAYAFFGPIRCRSVHRRFAKALYSEGYRVRIPPSPVPESSTRANRRASENERESEKSNRALRNIYADFIHFYGAILQVKFPLKNASLRFMTKVLRFPR